MKGGKRLTEDIVGSHYTNYDFTVVLSHFKGHAMGGFGGAIKIYLSVLLRLPERRGYTQPVKPEMRKRCGDNCLNRIFFWNRWLEAAKAVVDHCGDKIL